MLPWDIQRRDSAPHPKLAGSSNVSSSVCSAGFRPQSCSVGFLHTVLWFGLVPLLSCWHGPECMAVKCQTGVTCPISAHHPYAFSMTYVGLFSLLFSFGTAICSQEAAKPFWKKWRRQQFGAPWAFSTWIHSALSQATHAASLAGKFSITIITAQLYEQRPRGVVWFCTVSGTQLPGPPLTSRRCFLPRHVIDINSE